MGNSDNFDYITGFVKYDEIRKPVEQSPAHAECVYRKLVGKLTDTIDGRSQFRGEPLRHFYAFLAIPFGGGPPIPTEPPGEPGPASLGAYFSQESTLGFFPWDHFDGPIFNFSQTFLDLSKPSLLSILVHFLIQAIEERFRKSRAVFRRKLQRLFQDLRRVVRHALSIERTMPSSGLPEHRKHLLLVSGVYKRKLVRK